MCDAVLEKPVFVTAGKDDFEAILLASHRSLGKQSERFIADTIYIPLVLIVISVFLYV